MIDLKFLKSRQLVNVEATIHICASCNLFLRSLQVSQQQTPSLVGLADNIDMAKQFLPTILTSLIIKLVSIANNIGSNLF